MINRQGPVQIKKKKRYASHEQKFKKEVAY